MKSGKTRNRKGIRTKFRNIVLFLCLFSCALLLKSDQFADPGKQTSLQQSRQQSREIAQQALPWATTRRILDIPEDCYTYDVDADGLDFIELEHARGRSARIMKRQMPRILFVRENCREQFERAAQATQERYVIQRGRGAHFPYASSEPRDYCGTHAPAGVQCSVAVPEDSDLMVRIDWPTFPNDVGTFVERLRSGSEQPFAPESRPNYILFAFDTPAYSPSLRVVAHDGHYSGTAHAGTMAREYRTAERARGYITYVYRVPRVISRGTRGSSRFQGSIDTIIGPFFDGHNRPDVGGRFIDQVENNIAERAENLRHYWNASHNYLDTHEPGFELMSSDTRFDSNQLDGLSADARSPVLDWISERTHQIIGQATSTLLTSRDNSAILNAASIWWMTRDFRTNLGCDSLGTASESDDRPYSGLETFVTSEYSYQQCRRIFTRVAYQNLSRAVASTDESTRVFRLNSPDWIVAYATTSRLERSSIFAQMVPLLTGQIRRGIYPARVELSMIAHYVAQTHEELRRNQVLTWKGFEPMERSDRTQLEQSLTRIASFFMENRIVAERLFLDQPEFYFPFYQAWQLVREKLSLPEWPLASAGNDPRAVASDQIRARLARLRPSSTDALVELFRWSRLIQATNPRADTRLCAAWLDWISRNRSSARIRSTGTWQGFTTPNISSCLDTIPRWMRRTSVPSSFSNSSLSALCGRGMSLACETRNLLHEGTSGTQTLDAMIQQITDHSISRRPIANIINLFREQLLQTPQEDRALWTAAVSQITTQLRRDYYQGLSEVPPSTLLTQCTDEQQWWAALYDSTSVRPENVTITASCPRGQADQARRWFHELLELRNLFQEAGHPTARPILSRILAYPLWLFIMRDQIPGSDRRSRTPSETRARQAFERNWDAYAGSRGSFTELPWYHFRSRNRTFRIQLPPRMAGEPARPMRSAGVFGVEQTFHVDLIRAAVNTVASCERNTSECARARVLERYTDRGTEGEGE